MKSEPGNHLTSPFRRGHKFPLYRAETAAAEANEAFTARSSGAIFTKRAISGFHLTPESLFKRATMLLFPIIAHIVKIAYHQYRKVVKYARSC